MRRRRHGLHGRSWALSVLLAAAVAGASACAPPAPAPPREVDLQTTFDDRGAALVGTTLWAATTRATLVHVDTRRMTPPTTPAQDAGEGVQHQAIFAAGSLWVLESAPRSPSEGMYDPPEPRTVLRLDPDTGAVQHRWTVPGSDEYRGLAEGGGAVWISVAKRRADGTVLRIDPTTNALTMHRSGGLMPQPLLWSASHLWVGHGQPTLSIPSWTADLPQSNKPTVVRLDAAGRIASRTEIGTDMDAGGVVSLVQSGDRVLALTATGHWLAELDTNGTLLRQVQMPFGCDAPMVLGAGRLWQAAVPCAIDLRDGSRHEALWVADPATLALIGVVHTPGVPHSIAVDDASLWVSTTDLTSVTGDGGRVVRYDAHSLREIERFDFGGGWVLADGHGGVYAADSSTGAIRHLHAH